MRNKLGLLGHLRQGKLSPGTWLWRDEHRLLTTVSLSFLNGSCVTIPTRGLFPVDVTPTTWQDLAGPIAPNLVLDNEGALSRAGVGAGKSCD